MMTYWICPAFFFSLASRICSSGVVNFYSPKFINKKEVFCILKPLFILMEKNKSRFISAVRHAFNFHSTIMCLYNLPYQQYTKSMTKV